MDNILISGAGIAGLSLARQLKKRGLKYTLIEKKANLDLSGAGIALPANAVRALRYMGFSKAVDRMHQVKDIIYSSDSGRIISQAALDKEPLNRDKFVALSRAELLTVLKQDLEEDIQFNVTVSQLKQKKSGVEVVCSDPNLSGFYKAVIGADGLHSTVRELGFGPLDLVDLGVTNWRWICQYPTEELQPTYMLGKGNAFLAYPMGPQHIYCYAHQADEKASYFNADEAKINLQQIFAKYKGIAQSLLKILPENNQIYTGRLRSVPAPLFSQGSIALIGDAGNACSPMLQQGAACAFEDAIVLSELLAHFPVKEALAHYETLRSQRVHWIVTTSDEAIKSFIKIKSFFALRARNLLIRKKGPLNVLGWKHLLSTCPLDAVLDFIKLNTESSVLTEEY